MNDTLLVQFDRRDRTYRSGEPVRGELVIHSERGEACGTVHLRRFWNTRGRGNSDRGGAKAMLLHEGPLHGDPPHRVPFEFAAPGGPFTYHGSLLHIDHYVEARVDIPGLFDAGLPEEYVLVPGTEVDPPDPELLKVGSTRPSGARGCRVMVGALMVLFGFFTLPFGLVLLVPGLFLAFPMLWRAVAGAKIGEVSSATPEMIVSPGRDVRIRVDLRPKKAREINAADAVLRAREIVISGEGNDRRVHFQEVHSAKVTLSGPRRLTAGEKATLEAELEIPENAPYSFASKHNEVTWDVRVSVDIPTWPDWRREHRVVVWPPASREVRAEELQEADAVASAVPRRTRDRKRATGARRPLPEPRREPGPVGGPPSTPPPTSLAAAVAAILERKSFGGGRDPLVRRLLGSRFTFDLEVDLVKHTFGAGPDPVYRHGRTVTGTLAGTAIPVAVRFPADRNDEIDGYRRGAVHSVTGTVVDWEKLAEKPVLKA